MSKTWASSPTRRPMDPKPIRPNVGSHAGEFKQHGGMLGDIVHAISSNIADRDIFLSKSFSVTML
ncbi:hypothetical protein AGMMS49974_00160 [Deltaproteobacteria bacterium]|nr:hypothetical protein AGMMS49974_00160 [Deltaproteobacteria bacterium]GHV00257.1 hypothetical protein AGMMS50248_09670 [Deltaproteobacteria bacterium]